MKIHDHEQNTPEWKLARLGVPSASRASSIITSKGDRSKSLDSYAQYLAGCLYAGFDLNAWEGNKFTSRGHELEDDARSLYEFINNVDVTVTGFCTTDDELYGASPDGFIGNNLLEIKCLPKKHLEALAYWNKYEKTPPTYIQQTQMQLFVCKADYVDLLYFQPGLPHLCLKQEPIDEIQEGLETYLAEVIEIRDDFLTILKNM